MPAMTTLLTIIILLQLLIISALGYFYYRSRREKSVPTDSLSDLIIDNAPDIIIVKDEEFRIIKANKPFYDLFPEEKQGHILGYTLVEDFVPEEAEAFLAEDKKAFEHGYTKTEETIRFPNGDTRTLITQKVRFYDKDGKPYILGIANDITDQINLQKQTEESQAMFRMIMDFIPGRVFVKDAQSVIRYANKNFIDMFPLEMQDKVIGHVTMDDYPELMRKTLKEQKEEALKLGASIKKTKLEYPNGISENVVIRKQCMRGVDGQDYILGLITEYDLDKEQQDAA